MRPQVLDATRVRENWFLVSPGMARHYQIQSSGATGNFCRFCPVLEGGGRAGRAIKAVVDAPRACHRTPRKPQESRAHAHPARELAHRGGTPRILLLYQP